MRNDFIGSLVSRYQNQMNMPPYVIVNDNSGVRPNFDNQEVLENLHEILQKAKALRKKLTTHNPTFFLVTFLQNLQ